MSGAGISTHQPSADEKKPRPPRSSAPEGTSRAEGNNHAESTKRPATNKRKKRSQGWMPNQHGAWVMLIVPPIMGAIFAPSWTALPLILTWWAGYFTYFAITIWLKGRMRKKHLPPVLTYGGITAVAGIITLIAQWQLVAWLPIFAPIIALAVYEAAKRRERSLLSGWSTVLAASLMLPTVVSAATTGTPAAISLEIWLATKWFAAYFGGSIYYVKTLIRDFGDAKRFKQSIIVHAGFLIAAVVLTVAQPHTWAVAAVAAILLARAYAIPRRAQKRNKRTDPKTVGKIDASITIVVVAAAIAAFGS